MKKYIRTSYTGEYSNRKDYLNSLPWYKPDTFFKIPIEKVAAVRDALNGEIGQEIRKCLGQIDFNQDYWNLNPNAMVVEDNMATISYIIYFHRRSCSSSLASQLKELGFSEEEYYGSKCWRFKFFRGFSDDWGIYNKKFRQKFGAFYNRNWNH